MRGEDDQMPADSDTSVSDAAEPAKHRRYTLDELLAKCDTAAPAPESDRLWAEGELVGDEII
jgi:antitoxin component of MazEF toxin-antitoxin module